MGTVKNNSDGNAPDEINAAAAAFLALLESDIRTNPNRLRPLVRDTDAELRLLLERVEIDIDVDGPTPPISPN